MTGKERESDIFSEKLLSGAIGITYLPKEASGLPAWTASLATQLGRVGKSEEGVITKAVLFFVRNRHKMDICSRDPAQGGLLIFSKHVAAALTRAEVLNTSPELAAEITRHTSTAIDSGQPVVVGPILASIGHFCDYRREGAMGHTHMAFLSLRPASLKTTDV